MVHAVRNLGRPGVASMAISAVDIAPCGISRRGCSACRSSTLLGAARDAVAGLRQRRLHVLLRTSGSQQQLGGWVEQGIPRVKMKIGTHPARRPEPRARRPRGDRPGRRVVRRRQRRVHAQAGAGPGRARSPTLGVSWFEEPVSSDDLEGLRLLRDRGPAGMDIAAGEYGYDLLLLPPHARGGRRGRAPGRRHALRRHHRLPAGRRRCARRFGWPLSAHCAPSLHVHAVLRRPAAAPPGVFPRPRPHRADAVRRDRRPDGGACGPTARGRASGWS